MKTTTSIKPSNTDRPKYPLCWWCNDELEIPEYTVVKTRGWEVTVCIDCADEMVLEGEVVPSPSDDEPAAIGDRDQPGARSRQRGETPAGRYSRKTTKAPPGGSAFAD